MKNDSVFLITSIKSRYNNSNRFNPSLSYKEMSKFNFSIKTDGLIYNEVRNLFKQMELDKLRIDKEDWSPLSDLVKKGDTILIKPNLVIHRNLSLFGTMKSIVVNLAVIRPILDYSLKAVGKTGKVIIADSSVQDCDFDKLTEKIGLKNLIDEYSKVFNNIQLIDLRKNQNPNINLIEVDLKNKSMFDNEQLKNRKYSITNYAEDILNRSHTKKTHKYITSDIVLSADLIINVFKPKSHRIAGITASQKNLIGIISKKECLPHYSRGSTSDGGDEYPLKTNYRLWLTNLLKQKNKMLWGTKNFIKIFSQFLPNESIINGCWYKNDTIWRTILDVNYVIDFSDKYGKLKSNAQRKVLSIGDMIVCGEKNGPLHPNDKYVGCLISGFNRNNIDNVICEMMGFKKKYIKYIQDVKVSEFMDGKKIKEIHNYNFKPADGWKVIKEKK